METKKMKLSLLLKFINVALILILVSIIFTFVYSVPYADKFSKLANRLPMDEKFYGMKIWMNMITYLTVSKIVVFRIFFGIILFIVRRVVKSILSNGVFQDEDANRIRKIAIYFICFAGILLLWNFIFMLSAINKGNPTILRKSVLNLISIFENYVLTSLIIFGIAEVFVAGRKLKQENELTI